MGNKWIDQYSLLHFSVGVVAYFWSMSFIVLILLHTLFEFVENTKVGMNFINTYFTRRWPGGKEFSDSLENRISDTLFSGAGWICSYLLDKKYM
jgi:hypothetical protein